MAHLTPMAAKILHVNAAAGGRGVRAGGSSKESVEGDSPRQRLLQGFAISFPLGSPSSARFAASGRHGSQDVAQSRRSLWYLIPLCPYAYLEFCGTIVCSICGSPSVRVSQYSAVMKIGSSRSCCPRAWCLWITCLQARESFLQGGIIFCFGSMNFVDNCVEIEAYHCLDEPRAFVSCRKVWHTASLYHLVHTAALLAAPLTKHPHIVCSIWIPCFIWFPDVLCSLFIYKNSFCL